MARHCEPVNEYYDRNTGVCSLCADACNELVWLTGVCSTNCAEFVRRMKVTVSTPATTSSDTAAASLIPLTAIFIVLIVVGTAVLSIIFTVLFVHVVKRKRGNRPSLFCTERGEVTSLRDYSLSAAQQRRPLATGSDVTATRDGGSDAAAEAEKDDEEPSLCCKNDFPASSTSKSTA